MVMVVVPVIINLRLSTCHVYECITRHECTTTIDGTTTTKGRLYYPLCPINVLLQFS